MKRDRLKRKSKNNSVPPLRTCVVCRRRSVKDKLQRYVWDGERKTVVLDSTRTLAGRGAYCCRKEECEKQFLTRKKGWQRFFRLNK